MQNTDKKTNTIGLIRGLEIGQSLSFPISRTQVIQNYATLVNTERGCARGDVSISTKKNRDTGVVTVTRVK